MERRKGISVCVNISGSENALHSKLDGMMLHVCEFVFVVCATG